MSTWALLALPEEQRFDEGTLHPMDPFLLLFTPSGTKLHRGRHAGLLLVSQVENTSGGECLQTLRTPQAEG